MRVLVCGGRDFRQRDLLNATFRPLFPKLSAIICGGAPGADTLAWDWAWENRVTCYRYMADWKTHGKAAGPIRNQQMIDEGKPDLVIAFPGGRGTADMVRRAKAAGVEVREIA